eukprot:COSAG06_NODE_23537_length_688_cov_13.891341_1_plen_77_part_00
MPESEAWLCSPARHGRRPADRGRTGRGHAARARPRLRCAAALGLGARRGAAAPAALGRKGKWGHSPKLWGMAEMFP